MRLITWSTNARKDLEEIYNFYFTKNPTVAINIHNAIIDEVSILTTWPDIGQRHQFLDGIDKQFPFRSLITKDKLHKIIYFITDNSIVITHIWSCRKNPKNLKI